MSEVKPSVEDHIRRKLSYESAVSKERPAGDQSPVGAFASGKNPL